MMLPPDAKEIARLDALCHARRLPENAALTPLSPADRRAIVAAIEGLGPECARLAHELAGALMRRWLSLYPDRSLSPSPAAVTGALVTLWSSLYHSPSDPPPPWNRPQVVCAAVDRAAAAVELDVAAADYIADDFSCSFALGWDPHTICWSSQLEEAMSRGWADAAARVMRQDFVHDLETGRLNNSWKSPRPLLSERQRAIDVRAVRMLDFYLSLPGDARDPTLFQSAFEAADAARLALQLLAHELLAYQVIARGTHRRLDLIALESLPSYGASGLNLAGAVLGLSLLSLEAPEQEQARLGLAPPPPAADASAEDLLGFLADLGHGHGSSSEHSSSPPSSPPDADDHEDDHDRPRP